MRTIVLLLFTLFHFSARAQSHTFRQCSLNKEWANARKDAENNAPSCPACIDKRKKERVARQLEMKRRSEEAAAKARIEREAREKEFAAAQKRKQEEAKKPQSGEVLINAQTFTGTDMEPGYEQYEAKIENFFEKLTNRRCQILKNKKVLYETTEFGTLTQVYKRILFVGKYYTAGVCRHPNGNVTDAKGNHSVLMDQYGKVKVLNGIKRFGFLQTVGQESPDHFEIVVYTGECKALENDRYDKSLWTTIRYKFSFKTMTLVSTENSAQRGSCNCGDYN
ncbi:MAG: hypothetical protein EOP50_20905 [Sphingobacteriales bacterium]|nr:MAG: hypothetical protein EOP50_20905 [Sphingobacteriales bacterium]